MENTEVASNIDGAIDTVDKVVGEKSVIKNLKLMTLILTQRYCGRSSTRRYPSI